MRGLSGLDIGIIVGFLASVIVIGAWAAIGGTQIIGDFFKGSITGASDLNETLSKSAAIFGSSAADMEKWSSTALMQPGRRRLSPSTVRR